jgi:hypothetical protein
MFRLHVLSDPLEFVFLLFSFALRLIEMTIDLNFFSFVECPRQRKGQHVFFKNESILCGQRTWEWRSLRDLKHSSVHFSRGLHFHAPSISIVEDHASNDRAVPIDCGEWLLLLHSRGLALLTKRTKRTKIRLPVLGAVISPMVAYSLFPMN